MQCPHCHGTQVQRVEVVYQQGTTHSKSSGTTVGGGMAGDGFGLGAGLSSSNTDSRTLFAEQLAPPELRGYGWALFWLAVGVGMLFGDDFSVITRLIGAIFALMAGTVLYANICWNNDDYAREYNAWQNQWVCHQCGTKFDPPK